MLNLLFAIAAWVFSLFRKGVNNDAVEAQKDATIDILKKQKQALAHDKPLQDTLRNGDF